MKIKKGVFYLLAGVMLIVIMGVTENNEFVNAERHNVRVLIDVGHGGKYLRQKIRKIYAAVPVWKKYANKPKMECMIRQAEDYIDVNREDMAVRNSYPVGEREIHGDRW